ncbi:hypothetical protein SAMN05444001_10542 [Parabacteroides chinchillae]|uniref:Uncharacterized protein n=1 Tax=Parabacteroides chinchillae TaxID=871327 RepID=A0A8G2F297_9BACT|nr:hypothetical protein SAMN05444001_10542 [Parabacteroides chinchillae]
MKWKKHPDDFFIIQNAAYNLSSGRTNFSTLRKLTLLGLCAAAFQFQVIAASSQMITLSITRGTISDVFKAIESQSDYKFYNNSI